MDENKEKNYYRLEFSVDENGVGQFTEKANDKQLPRMWDMGLFGKNWAESNILSPKEKKLFDLFVVDYLKYRLVGSSYDEEGLQFLKYILTDLIAEINKRIK